MSSNPMENYLSCFVQTDLQEVVGTVTLLLSGVLFQEDTQFFWGGSCSPDCKPKKSVTLDSLRLFLQESSGRTKVLTNRQLTVLKE